MFQTPLTSLSLCFNLQDVSNNQLTAIPTSFALLVNLVRLNLAWNQLKELPADLSAMKSKSLFLWLLNARQPVLCLRLAGF